MNKRTSFLKKRRLLRLILTIFSLSYAFICVYFYVYQNNLLFHPEAVAEYHPKSLEAYERFYVSDGLRLHGWHIHDPNVKKPLLVYFGGNSEHVGKSIEEYYEQTEGRYDLLTVEYRGFGKSEGTPNEAALVQDGIRIVQEVLATHGYIKEQLVLIGRSLGTGVAIQVASELQPKAIILLTPYDSINAIAEYAYPYVPIRYLNENPFLSDHHAPNLDMSGLWIIAEHDTVTPPKHGHRLAQLMRKQPTVVALRSATHSNIYDFSTTWQSIKKFLIRELGASPTH